MSINTQIEAAKASPPIAVSFLDAIGVPIDQLLMLLTVVYTFLMIAHLAYKFAWDVIERRRNERHRKSQEMQADG